MAPTAKNSARKISTTHSGFTSSQFTTTLVLSLALIGLALTSVLQTATAQQPGQNTPVASAQKQIQTLAVVNGQQVTRNQIANECMRRFGKEVLEAMVKKMLVLQHCQKNGINITEKDVNDEIVAKAKNFGMSGERYIQTICGRRNLSLIHI